MATIEGRLRSVGGPDILLTSQPEQPVISQETIQVSEKRQQVEYIFQERREIITSLEAKIVHYPEQVLLLLGNLRENVKRGGKVGQEASRVLQSLERTMSALGYSTNERLLQEVYDRKLSGEVPLYPEESTKLDKAFEQVSVIRDEDGTPFFEVIYSTDSWLAVEAQGENSEERERNQTIIDDVTESYRAVKELRSGGVRNTPKIIWRQIDEEELSRFESQLQEVMDPHDVAEFTNGRKTIESHRLADPQAFADSLGMGGFLETESGTLAGHGWAGSPDAFKRRALNKLKKIDKAKKAVYVSGAFMGNDILRDGRKYTSQESSRVRKQALGIPLERISIRGYANSVEDEFDELGWMGRVGMQCEEEGWSMGGEVAERLAANVTLRDIGFFALPPGTSSEFTYNDVPISEELLAKFGLSDIPSVDTVTQIRANFKVKSFTPAKRDACIFQVFPKVPLSIKERAHTVKSRALLTAGDLVFATPLKYVPGVRRLAGGIVQWFARDLLPEKSEEVEVSGKQHGEVCQKNWRTVQKQSEELRNSDGISDEQLQALSRGHVPVVRFVSTGDKLVHLEAVLYEIQQREKPAGFEPTTVLLDWGHNALATEETRSFPEEAWMELTPLEWALYQDIIEQASRMNAGMQLTETEQLIIRHYNTMANLSRLLDFQISTLLEDNPQSRKLRQILIEDITHEFEAGIQNEPKADLLRQLFYYFFDKRIVKVEHKQVSYEVPPESAPSGSQDQPNLQRI